MPTSRHLLLRVPPPDSANHVRVRSIEASIQVTGIHHLRETLRDLSKLAGYTILPIDAYIRRVDSDADTLEESMLDIRDVLSTTRMHLSLNALPDPASSLLPTFEISHLIAAAEKGLQSGWHFNAGAASATIVTSLQSWPLLVHDILLDIAVFHSRKGLMKRFGTSASRSRQFSALKAHFILKNAKGGETFYGPVRSANSEGASYLPVACLCRSAAGLNLQQFHDLWNDLDREVSSRNAPTNAVDYILAYHPKAHQLSRKRLSSLVPRNAGRYVLVRGEKRPKNPPLNRTVPRIFGTDRKRWHAGRLKVLEPTEATLLRKYFPYISLFPFEVL
jgi:hypothetical protein